MAKYHVNPETGEPGLCHASIQCRFGGASLHYDSSSEARFAYEQKFSGEGFETFSKGNSRMRELMAQRQELTQMLRETPVEDELEQRELDALVEKKLTEFGAKLAEEADRRLGGSPQQFRDSLAQLTPEQRQQALSEQLRRMSEANLSVIGDLRSLGGALASRVVVDNDDIAASMVLHETVEHMYPSDWIAASNEEAESFRVVGIGAARASYGDRVLQYAIGPHDAPKLAVTEPSGYYYIPVKLEQLEQAKQLLGPSAHIVEAPAYLEPDGLRKVLRMPLETVADDSFTYEANVNRSGDEPATKPLGEGWVWKHYIDWRSDTVSERKGWTKPVENHEVVYMSVLRIANPQRDENTGEISPITDNQRRTAIHEFAHRIEERVPTIMRMEHAFLNRRTADADGNPRPLQYIYPPLPTDSFMSAERGRDGGFVDNYIGKEYVDSPAREVFSVGMESVLAGTYEGLVGYSNPKLQDSDMRAFIMGLLASA